MTATIDRRLRACVTLVLDAADGSFTSARVMRMFDEARRDLALELTGGEGVGAGYDGLRIEGHEFEAIGPGDVVTVTALAGAVHPHGHQVDYMATASSRGLGDHRTVSLLAQAHGWTVADGRATRAINRRLQNRADR